MLISEKWIVILTISLSLLFKTYLILNSSLTFFSDEAIYAIFTQNWAEKDLGQILHPFWPPFYPLVSSLVFPLFSNWENTLRFVSALSSCLLFIPIYFLSKNFLHRNFAYLVALSSVYIKPVFDYSLLPLSDTLSALLILSFLTTFVYFIKTNNLKLLVLSSIISGLSYLTRSEGLLFFYLGAGFLVYLLLLSLYKRKIPYPQIFALVIYTLTFLITISPYLLGVKTHLGFWSFSHKFSAQIQQGHAFLLLDNTTWAQEIWAVKSPNYQSPLWQGGTDHILKNERYFFKWFVQKLEVWKKIFLINYSYFFVPFFLLGIISLFLKKQKQEMLFILSTLVISIPITIFSIASSELRYLLWTVPIFLLFFVAGVNKFISFFVQKNSILPFVFLSLFLLPAYNFSFLNLDQTANEITKHHYRPELITVSNWIKDNSDSKSFKILTRHEAVEFYSGGETIYIPQVKLDELLDYAQEKQADYLVAWERELAGEPELKKLADINFTHPKLTQVFAISTKEGNIIVYTFNY